MTPLTTLNMADSLQNHLFQSPNFAPDMQLDLAATNINRGRDHGYPSFVNFRKFCGLGLAKTFDDLKKTMPISSIQKLQSVYSNVADVDLWVGGLAEGAFLDSKNRLDNTFRSGGSVVGATFECLLKLQFSELKRSDRFYYENAPNDKKGTASTAFTLGN
jgi:peroxidase